MAEESFDKKVADLVNRADGIKKRLLTYQPDECPNVAFHFTDGCSVCGKSSDPTACVGISKSHKTVNDAAVKLINDLVKMNAELLLVSKETSRAASAYSHEINHLRREQEDSSGLSAMIKSILYSIKDKPELCLVIRPSFEASPYGFELSITGKEEMLEELEANDEPYDEGEEEEILTKRDKAKEFFGNVKKGFIKVGFAGLFVVWLLVETVERKMSKKLDNMVEKHDLDPVKF